MKKNEKTKNRFHLILIFGLILAMALISFETAQPDRLYPHAGGG